MFLRAYYDDQAASGVPGTSTGPFTKNPFLEPLKQTVGDYGDTAALVGQFLGQRFFPADTGGQYTLNIPAGLVALGGAGALLKGGVVEKAAPTVAGNQFTGQANTVQVGYANALCVAPSALVAIVPGTLLTPDGAGNLQPFQPPSAAPTPTGLATTGTAGAATVSYKLFAVSYDGVYSALGTQASITTANATLSSTNAVTGLFAAGVDAAYIGVVRTAGGPSQGLIGIIPAANGFFWDIGQAAVTGTSATTFAVAPAAPGGPTVAQVTGATAGTSSYSYKVTAIGPNGVWSAESGATTLTTSALNLTPANGNKVTGINVTGAVLYAIDRSAAPAGVATGLIGFTSSLVTGFVDTGNITPITFATLQNLATANQPLPTPRPGLVAAVSLGSLAAATTVAASTLVDVGGC